MWVKVDYSTEAKKNPRRNMSGQWAIYTKEHWWNNWIERETFSDVDFCNRQAKKYVEYPKYYFNW